VALPFTFPAVWPYLAPAELRNFYAQAEIDQLADRDGDNVPDAGPVYPVLESAIERAASELDSYLSHCYPLPLQPAAGFAALQPHIANLLAEWTGVVARYRLYDDVRIRSNGEQKTEARLRYEDLLKRLGVASGNCKCTLLGPSVLTNQQAGVVTNFDMPEFTSNGSVFKRTDYDFRQADSDGTARSHSGRAFNELQ
jgi:phage gp36-like protein